MPLEIPTPSEQLAKIPTFAWPGGRWTTRFEGDKPKQLGTGGGFVYARDRKTGYLTKAPSAPSDRASRALYVDYMDEYGEHEDGIVQRLGVNALQRPWDMLLRFGGAKEFPVAQVMEHMWQFTPPIVDGEAVVFPQLEGMAFEPINCPFCFRALPSEQGKRNHVTVMHADRVAADDLATGVTKGMKAAMDYNRPADIVAPVSIEPTVEPGPEIWRCTQEGCTRFFDTEGGRNAHAYKPHDLVMAE